MQRVWSVYLAQEDTRHRARNSPPMDHSSLSVGSSGDANSVYSNAESTHHILETSPTTGPNSTPRTPKTPFSFANRISQFGNKLPLPVNYVPSKFSGSILSSSGARFRGGKPHPSTRLSKWVDAPKGAEARWAAGSEKLRWNKFKWILFITNSIMSIYSLGAMIVCLLTWFDALTNADIIRTGNRPELVVSTIAASFGIFTSVIGWAGILLNNRSFLAWYTFLTWITFGFLVSPGYITYKRHTFNLEGKINDQWSQMLGSLGRLKIQNQLRCCGYFSPFVEATVSQTCYSRSILPGCKSPYLQFEKSVLKKWYLAVFLLVPPHIAVMVAGLLCSNHITYRFGKGMMPEAYRLNMSTMAVIMENYAKNLTEQYGQEVADQIISKTQAVLQRSTYSPTS